MPPLIALPPDLPPAIVDRFGSRHQRGELRQRGQGVGQRHAWVARLVTLGLDPSNSDETVLRVLGAAPYSVVSTHPTTYGAPVCDLDPAAARRLFLRRKLEGCRDGELVLPFVGVAENALRIGSGHVLQRRWEGHDEHGEPDLLGGISYRIAMPKPLVNGGDGASRRGWLTGMSDQEQRAAWNRLIALRGTDDRGRRPVDELDRERLDANPDLEDDDREVLAQERERAKRRRKGGRQASVWRTSSFSSAQVRIVGVAPGWHVATSGAGWEMSKLSRPDLVRGRTSAPVAVPVASRFATATICGVLR